MSLPGLTQACWAAEATGTRSWLPAPAAPALLNRISLRSRPPARDIAVTFTAVVPDFTPGDVYLSYRIVGTEGWNYTQLKMNKIADLEWQWNGTLLEGKRYEFMISRGSAATEMRAADGNTLLTPIEYALEYHETARLN